MVGNILGIDINDSSVSGVLLKCGLKTDRIVSCASVVFSEDGGVAGAVNTLLEKMMPPNVVCVTGIPAESVSFRNLKMPFGDQKSIRKTLLFELENRLPYGVDNVVADFIVSPSPSGKTNLLAASVAGSWLAERLTFLKERGFDPELLDVRNVPIVSQLLKQKDVPDDGLFLEIRRKKCTMVLFCGRRIVLVRSLSLNLSKDQGDNTRSASLAESTLVMLGNGVKKTIAALRHCTGIDCLPQKLFITGPAAADPQVPLFFSSFFDTPIETVDLCQGDLRCKEGEMAGQWNPFLMNNALALALRDNKQQGFNFRRDGFAVKKQFARFKKEIIAGAVYALVFLATLAVDATIDRSHLEKRMADLDTQVKVIFSQTFPEVKRVVSPVQQMRIKIRELEKGSSAMPVALSKTKVIDLMEDISKRIPEKFKISVTRMVVDQDSIILKGMTDTFNTVDGIKKELGTSAYYDEVTIASANLSRSGDGVQFELKLSRAADNHKRLVE